MDDTEVYALKVLKKSMIKQKHQESHLRDERRLLGEMAGCPWIVQLYRTFEDESNVYMLMEYLQGGELFSVLRRAVRLSIEDTKFYAAEIVCALDSLHSKGIAYRDLKPENVLLDKYGHVKLVDMGFAKQIGSKRTGTMCGTPEYLAPEIVQGRGHCCAVDWWSLGVLIYELLAGYSPFNAPTLPETYQRIVAGSYSFPEYFDASTKDIISELLSLNPNLRLGNLGAGAMDVMSHPFFASVRWNEVKSWTGRPLETDGNFASESATMGASLFSGNTSMMDLPQYADFDSNWMPAAPAFEGDFSTFSSLGASTNSLSESQSTLSSSTATLNCSSSTLKSSTSSLEPTIHPLFPLNSSAPAPSHMSMTSSHPIFNAPASHYNCMNVETPIFQGLRLAEEKISWSQAQGKSSSHAPASCTYQAPIFGMDRCDVVAPLSRRVPKKTTIHIRPRASSRLQTRGPRKQPKTQQRLLRDRFAADMPKSAIPRPNSPLPTSIPTLQFGPLKGASFNDSCDLDGYTSPAITERSEIRLSDMFADEVDLDDSPVTSPDASPRAVDPLSLVPSQSVFPEPCDSPVSQMMAGFGNVNLASPAAAPPLGVLPPFQFGLMSQTSDGQLHHPTPTTVVPQFGFSQLKAPAMLHQAQFGFDAQQHAPYTQNSGNLHIQPEQGMCSKTQIAPAQISSQSCAHPHIPPFIPSCDGSSNDNSFFDVYSEDASLYLPIHRPDCAASCALVHTFMDTIVFDPKGSIVNQYGAPSFPQAGAVTNGRNHFGMPVYC